MIGDEMSEAIVHERKLQAAADLVYIYSVHMQYMSMHWHPHSGSTCGYPTIPRSQVVLLV